MAAFKQCDGCGRHVSWSASEERKTWLELHWDVLEEEHPEQVWDFCGWDCLVTFALGQRRGEIGDLLRSVGERLMSNGVTQEDYVTALDRERALAHERLVTSRDVRALLDQLDRPSDPTGSDQRKIDTP